LGHAGALLGLADAEAMKRAAGDVVGKHLSVRATEQLVRRLKAGKAHPKKREDSAQVRALVDQLQRALGTKARIIDRGGKGRLEIEFFSYADLDRVLARLLPDKR
jgi:ParB family chromosome partitioning protein